MRKRIPEHDLKEAYRNYDESSIDPEFLPFIKRINQLDFVVTCQCCSSHMTFENKTGNWGYLSLYLLPEYVHKLAENISPVWLLKERSKIWYEGAINPTLTENGSLMVVFAWDATYWPIPAQEITEALEIIDDL